MFVVEWGSKITQEAYKETFKTYKKAWQRKRELDKNPQVVIAVLKEVNG